MFRRQRCGGGIGHGKALVRSAADVTDLVGRCGRVQRQFSGAAPRVMVRDRGNRMINRKMGQAGRAASPPLIALALLLAGVVPAFSPETTTSRPLDFRLPPAGDDNPTPAPPPVQPATPPSVIPTHPATVTTPAPTATQRDTPATPRPVPSVPAPSAPSDATDNPTLPPLEATTPATPTAPGTTSERPIAADKAPVAAGPTSPSSGT